MNSNILPLAAFFLAALLLPTVADARSTIGINYGRVADNLPPPLRSVELIKRLNFGAVKLFDANLDVLSALSNSGLEVTVGVTNQEIAQLSSDPSAADQWVQKNVLAHFPSTRIRFIDVGNEILSDADHKEAWNQLVPAMRNIYKSLAKSNISKTVKVTTSMAMDVLNVSYPPSAGTFRSDVAESILKPMLRFLSRSNSYFFINVYPYFAWSADTQQIHLDYALFGLKDTEQAVPDGEIKYTDLLSAQIDAVIAAMEKVGYPNVKIAISETGWPSGGDPNQLGANFANAARYNTRLVRKMLGEIPIGTPRRPGIFIPTFIFALFDEDQKPGVATERNWGLLYPNGSAKYTIDLRGELSETEYLDSAILTSLHSLPALPTPGDSPSIDLPILPTPASSHYHNSSLPPSSFSSATPSSHPTLPSIPSQIIPSFPAKVEMQWCVVNFSVDVSDVQKALDYACGSGGADCKVIHPGEPCFLPNSIQAHASYAFNSYWQKAKHAGGTCFFGGTAMLTNVNPSYKGCSFEFRM